MAHFEVEVCQTYPFPQKCPAQKGERDPRWHLRISQELVNVSQGWRRSLAHQEEGHSSQAVVEATIRRVKYPFPTSKLSVRGRFRVTRMVIGLRLTSNIRHIQRYLEAKIKLEHEQMNALRGQEKSLEQPLAYFFASLKAIFRSWIAFVTLQTAVCGFK